MATQEELVKSLTFLEKQSYSDIIDVAIKEYNEKTVLFTMLNVSIGNSLNRANAILESYSTKYKNTDITSSYTVFQGILSSISGQVPDLDKTNGLINMMIYGNSKTQREIRRFVFELRKRSALLVGTILTDVKKAKEDLNKLKGQVQ